MDQHIQCISPVHYSRHYLLAERDPAFLQICQEKLPKDKKIIVYCGLGGTLVVGAPPYKPGGKSFKDDPERMFGRESRSLKAIYELLQVSTARDSD